MWKINIRVAIIIEKLMKVCMMKMPVELYVKIELLQKHISNTQSEDSEQTINGK